MASFVRHGKKIVAIGRNYAAHAKELNNAMPKEPFFFLKPTSSYNMPEGGGKAGKLEIPIGIVAHHEVELGVVIGKGGREISQANADTHIAGYTLAVDITARNLQDRVRREGLPWSAAKGFDTFTQVGQFLPKDAVKDPHDLRLLLKINGEIKQNGSTGDMMFKIPRLIEHISSIMTLQEDDLILTGTPQGVGPILPGDHVECALLGPEGSRFLTLDFDAVQRQGGYQFPDDKAT